MLRAQRTLDTALKAQLESAVGTPCPNSGVIDGVRWAGESRSTRRSGYSHKEYKLIRTGPVALPLSESAIKRCFPGIAWNLYVIQFNFYLTDEDVLILESMLSKNVDKIYLEGTASSKDGTARGSPLKTRVAGVCLGYGRACGILTQCNSLNHQISYASQ